MNQIKDAYTKLKPSDDKKQQVLNEVYKKKRKFPSMLKLASLMIVLVMMILSTTQEKPKQEVVNPNIPDYGIVKLSSNNNLDIVTVGLDPGGHGFPSITLEKTQENMLHQDHGNITHLHVFKNPNYYEKYQEGTGFNFTKSDMVDAAQEFISLFNLNVEEAKYEINYGISTLSFENIEFKKLNVQQLMIKILDVDKFIEHYDLEPFPEKPKVHVDKESVVKQLSWVQSNFELTGDYTYQDECEWVFDMTINDFLESCSYSKAFKSNTDDEILLFNRLTDNYYVHIWPHEDDTFELTLTVTNPYPYESLGYYPVISLEDATELLLKHHYLTHFKMDDIKREDIYGAQLKYFESQANETILPVYEFMVAVDFGLHVDPNYVTYALFYVPAIEPSLVTINN